MVSVNVINSILLVIEKLTLDKKSISEISKINLIETENALNVLLSHGYVLKSNSKVNHKGKKYKFIYYIASESAKEILKKGGFTKQLSMKENNKTSIKNKMSFKDTTINGNVGQDSRFENMPINNNTNDTSIKKEPKSILFKIWGFTDHKLISQIIIIIISLILGYFGFKNL